VTSEHFNRLTPAEAERLALLMEECGEVVQIVGKILRHGYDSTHPNGGPTNRELLARELGDLRAAYFLMLRELDVSAASVARACSDKAAQVVKYLHHQE
jgi:NTP pyrophosphatase (non-canonical NTP hydrolase)